MTAETAQHTPGPWRYARQNNGGIGVFAGENYEHLLFEAPEFFSPNPADWALVEAAPDLLAAAEQAIFVLEACGPERILDGEETLALDLLHAARQRATHDLLSDPEVARLSGSTSET